MSDVVDDKGIAIVPPVQVSHRVQVAAEKGIREARARSILGCAPKRILEAHEEEGLLDKMSPVNALPFCGNSDRFDERLGMGSECRRIRFR
jgi:hypothetical protein